MSSKTWLYIKRGVGILLLIVMTMAMFSAADELVGRQDGMGQRNDMDVPADVLFMGSSHTFCSVIPQKLMDDYGIAALNESTTGMMSENQLLLLKLDIPKYQPKVVFTDLFGFLVPYTYSDIVNDIEEKGPRYLINLQKTTGGLTWFDPQKYRILYEHEKQVPGSLPYGFLLYSSHQEFMSWNLPLFSNPKRSRPFASRLYYWFRSGSAPDDPIRPYTDEELAEVHMYEPFKETLDEMIELAESNNVSLVFTLFPYQMNRAEEKVVKEVETYLAEKNVPVITAEDFKDKAKIDGTTDFFDLGHLNYNGAVKVTDMLGAYIDENYDLPDRRLDDDPKYDPWKKMPYSYLADQAASQLKETTDFETYMRYLADLNEDYTVMIGSDGNAGFWQDPANVEIWSKYSDIDPHVVFAEDVGYMALLNGREIHHQASYNGEYLYLDYVKDNGYKAECIKDWIIRLSVNGDLYTREDMGLMVVVFNAVDDTMVDSVCFDFTTGQPVAIR